MFQREDSILWGSLWGVRFQWDIAAWMGPPVNPAVFEASLGIQNALPSHQQQRCLRAWRGDRSSAKPTAPQAMILTPAWQDQAQMSPNDPTDVIISGKRLIGQHTMSLPLIKKHSRKTKIATKHCQQSNQQQQLAFSSVLSWALRREQGGSRAGGYEKSSPNGPCLHTEGFCSKTLGLGVEVGRGCGGGGGSLLVGFCAAVKGPS